MNGALVTLNTDLYLCKDVMLEKAQSSSPKEYAARSNHPEGYLYYFG
jgi:hypothetical protein